MKEKVLSIRGLLCTIALIGVLILFAGCVTMTPLMKTAKKGNIKELNVLLDSGADVNENSGFEKYTPLHMAAIYGHEEVAKLLIAKGADVNAKQQGGWTPLHYAAHSGQTDMVGILLDAGADPSIPNKYGSTPWRIAQKRGYTTTARILMKAQEEPYKHYVKTHKDVKPPEIIQTVDVDVNIPGGSTELKDGLCVIFGLEKYKYAPDATFANRDAAIFFEYAKSVFGLPKRNIYMRTNEGATKGEFDKVFGENGWIERRIVKGKSDVIIYFSGHGAPDIKTKKAYLIPYDIDPNYASTAYSLEDVYRNLSRSGAKSVTIFLDACFSGVSREKEALLADARPLRVRPGSPETYENITVFAASTGEEISSSYREKKHGLFTYYLLKGLQGYADRNKDKKIRAEELFNYIRENVRKEAGFMDREQSPQLLGGKKERLIIRLK